MRNPFDVVAIVGSLRRESLSRRLALALGSVASAGLALEFVPLAGLCMYNADEESNPPPSWLRFRDRIRSSDGVLFVTPEYNRSMPGVLKNAIDVGSRPYGKSVWNAKPTAVVSCSPGAAGGFGAHHHLRQCLAALNMPTLAHPEAYIGGVDRLVAEGGSFADPATRDFCASIMFAFENWIGRHLEPSRSTL